MSDTAPSPADSGQPVKKTPRRFLGFDVTLDWLLRPLFGMGLAAIALAATYFGGFYFALFVSAGCFAAAREWHRMFAGEKYGWLSIVSGVAIIAATASEVVFSHSAKFDGVPWLIIAFAALVNSVLASSRRAEALWHAGALFYIGVPALSLVAIREVLPNGLWLLLPLFVAVWATDTGALFTGNLIKGPKLWPALSPNKTWAGFLGGIAFGAAAAALIFLYLHANVLYGALLGASASVVGHAGDLFESWMKRRVGRKNSGSLIPGHGGVLDRVDSMLFVAPVAALVFLALHINPLIGAAAL
ncbi:MAG TPA: phosphatidate cytidylyltransferase [Rhizomicrobium sp.]